MATLIIIDRETGEEERISSVDANFAASIAGAAYNLCVSPAEALRRLRSGETLETAGFLRRMEP